MAALISLVASAGQVVRVGETIELVRTIEPAVLERQLAWRDGMLFFDGDPLETHSFDIPAQPANLGLTQLAQQARVFEYLSHRLGTYISPGKSVNVIEMTVEGDEVGAGLHRVCGDPDVVRRDGASLFT